MEPSEQQGVGILSAGPQDMDSVFGLRLLARKTDAGLFPTSYEDELNKSLEEKQRWFNNPKQIIVLAKTQDEAVGMMGAREKGVGEWYLHGVYVRPEFRRRHVGEDMMRVIVCKIRERPEARIITFQAEVENVPALEMYKKYGFEIIGTDKAVLGDGKEHDKYVFSQDIQKIRI